MKPLLDAGAGYSCPVPMSMILGLIRVRHVSCFKLSSRAAMRTLDIHALFPKPRRRLGEPCFTLNLNHLAAHINSPTHA
jgi:hypothetical protein